MRCAPTQVQRLSLQQQAVVLLLAAVTSWFLLLQILTMKQAGEVMVHSYPKMPVLEELLNTFAIQRGGESEEHLVARAHENDMQAEWTMFWNYTKFVNPDYVARYEYVPLREQPCHSEMYQVQQAASGAAKARAHVSSSSSADKVLNLY